MPATKLKMPTITTLLGVQTQSPIWNRLALKFGDKVGEKFSEKVEGLATTMQSVDDKGH